MIGTLGLTAILLTTLIAAFPPATTAPGHPTPAIPDRDKTGTTGPENRTKNPPALLSQVAAGQRFTQAERGGFEPPVPISQDTAFPVPHNRPLCHLSGNALHYRQRTTGNALRAMHDVNRFTSTAPRWHQRITEGGGGKA